MALHNIAMVAPDSFITNVPVPLVRRATPCYAIFGLVIGTVLVSNAPWTEHTTTFSVPSTTFHHFPSSNHFQRESHHRHVSSLSLTNSSVPETDPISNPTDSSQRNPLQLCPVVPPKLGKHVYAFWSGLYVNHVADNLFLTLIDR